MLVHLVNAILGLQTFVSVKKYEEYMEVKARRDKLMKDE